MSITEKKSGRSEKFERARLNIDWAVIDSAIGNGTASVSRLANDYEITPNEMRELIIEHYGDTVCFRRGRGGGIKWRANVTGN